MFVVDRGTWAWPGMTTRVPNYVWVICGTATFNLFIVCMLHKKCLTWFGREKFQEYFYKYQLPSWSTWRATIDWVQVIIIPEVLNRSSVTRLENRRKGITYLDRDYSTIYWLPLSDTHRNHRSIGVRQEQQQQQQQVWWPEQEEIKHILKTKGIPVIWKLPVNWVSI